MAFFYLFLNFFNFKLTCKRILDKIEVLSICKGGNIIHSNLYDSIKNNFLSIKRRGWIKSQRMGPTGVGYTLEKLLNITENCFAFPDLYPYEIKTHRCNSKYSISLFNAAPDGEELFEIKRVCKTYGYPDKIIKMSKILCCTMNANEMNSMGIRFRQQLFVDYKSEKIFLNIFNNRLEMIDNKTWWSFKYLKERYETKLKYLILITARSKCLNGTEYFKYDTITLYQAKNFDTFLKLISNGIINISFKISCFRTGKNVGKIRDHGTGFSIQKSNIDLLFDKL